MALRHDLIAHRRVQRSVQVVQQQRSGVAVGEPLEDQLGQLGEDVVTAPRAGRADDGDPFGEETTGDEPEDLRRRVVEPLRVVDDADQRLLLGDLGEQRQRCQADQEAVGRGARAQPEHRRQRIALRTGQPVEVIEHRHAELMQPAVGQLHLRLDARRRRDVPALDPIGHVAQQGALADAGLTAHDNDAAPAGARVRQQPVEHSHSLRRPSSFEG